MKGRTSPLLRRASGICAVVWAVLVATRQVVMGMGVTALPGKWRHECHFRRQCHPDRPLGLPEWRKKEAAWKPEK